MPHFNLQEITYITHISLHMSRVLKLVSGTNEIIIDNNKKLHAEQNVLLKSRRHIKYSRKGYDIYSLRVFKSGRLANAKPCSMCVMRMAKSRLNIRDIYYSDENGHMIKVSFKELMNHRLNNSRGTRL